MEGQNLFRPIWKWQAREDDPKTNNKIILTHVAFKGAQTGSILMSIIPLIVMRGNFRAAPFLRGQILGTVSTSLGSVGAAYYMLKTSDPIKNYDRAYRLQFNSVQNRCDKYSVAFSGGCLVLSLWLFPIPTWTLGTIEKFAGMACFGQGLGAVCHYVTKNGQGLEMLSLWR